MIVLADVVRWLTTVVMKVVTTFFDCGESLALARVPCIHK